MKSAARPERLGKGAALVAPQAVASVDDSLEALEAAAGVAAAAAATACAPQVWWLGMEAAAATEVDIAPPSKSKGKVLTYTSFFELFKERTGKPSDWCNDYAPTKEDTLAFATFMANTRRRRSLHRPEMKGLGQGTLLVGLVYVQMWIWPALFPAMHAGDRAMNGADLRCYWRWVRAKVRELFSNQGQRALRTHAAGEQGDRAAAHAAGEARRAQTAKVV